ncbi:glycosyl transferase [Paractinoplanes abujensis]|uniref:Glycosyltransferase involved in cell wall biosynthesis n=1 Tax=Paractinoplanes abujensis TaxID=882441 RepID=A0A7W7D3N5_9ACTN|nr:glycosyltransferase [Actinoplanes abujensis]MBB4698403.1 glycosyltransferase involved in cell wall biosynthesis [Actinoplanes abujensis]GID19111.1 glycosyl transferase [Actinoplanes abujensis]
MAVRVLHVISARAGDGAEHQLRLLIRNLPQESEVVTLSPPGPVLARMRADGTAVHEIASSRDLDPAAIVRLRRLTLRGGFDVVHTHLFRASVQGRLAAWLAGVAQVVATEYHLDEGRRTVLAHRGRGRFTIAVSALIAERLRRWGVPGDRVTVIPKALDTGEFGFDAELRDRTRSRLGIAPGTPVIGGLGRLEPRKRFDVLIRAVAEVPGAVLLLVGDGSARRGLERLAAIEGVADRVLFAGPVRHARAMFCAMDVFASPGRETFGLVVLEAIAAGLPALYATCEALADKSISGAERLTPHDPESLPRKLRAEVLCLAERAGGRLAPRSAGDRYDAERMAAEVGDLYERVSGAG